MKLGVCTTPDRLPLLRELGFDYMEASLYRLTALDDETLCAETAMVERSEVPVETCNGFFPKDMSICPQGDDPCEADRILREVAAYAERGLSLAARWGVRFAVLGSGSSRRVPDGEAPWEVRLSAAEAHFAHVLAICGEAAERHGMRLGVEPLSRRETNFIHTVAEGARMARLSGHPAVGVIADLFHMWDNGDDPAALPALGERLWHAHLARPNPDRNVPSDADAEAMAAWAAILRQCPGVERLSLEGAWLPDFETALRRSVGVLSLFR